MAGEVVISREGGRNAVALISAVLAGDFPEANRLADRFTRDMPGDTIRALSHLGAMFAHAIAGLSPEELADPLLVISNWGDIMAHDPVLATWPSD